jgi:hypothetical protein
LENLPFHIAGSTGETLSVMFMPTAVLNLVGRSVKQAEEYEVNNGKEPDYDWWAKSLTADAMLMFGERFIITKAISDIVRKKGTVVGSIGLAMGAEAVQEGLEQTKETMFTQKEGEKTFTEVYTIMIATYELNK